MKPLIYAALTGFVALCAHAQNRVSQPGDSKSQVKAESAAADARRKRQLELPLEAKISTAYNLATVQRKPADAKQMLSELLSQTNSVNIRVQALDVLALAEQRLKNFDAVDECYRQLGEALARQGNSSEDVRRCGHVALDGLFRYQGFLLESKRTATNLVDLKAKITAALDVACGEPGTTELDQKLRLKLGGAHLDLARRLKTQGKIQMACLNLS